MSDKEKIENFEDKTVDKKLTGLPILAKFRRPKKPVIRKYGLLYFDHLRGERLAINTNEQNLKNSAFYSNIEKKRDEQTLTWDDIYAYQLMLLEQETEETLKNKIISLRIKYQNLVEIADFNNYMTMRGVKLIEPAETDIKKLRADYRFLLDEFFLRYAYASTYEDLRTRILRWVGFFTFLCLFIAVGIGIITVSDGAFFREPISEADAAMGLKGKYFAGYERVQYLLELKNYFSTLFIVIFAGVMGAFVSIQQRFQSASRQGDPVYSLALLTHGWFSIFLSPLSGAIFAALLYLFFAGGILSGTIFPELSDDSVKDKPPQQQSQSSDMAKISQSVSKFQPTVPNTADATSSVVDDKPKNIGITKFSIQTGPRDNKAFALLIIWSFIAGFAERFVPDTLMRMVNQRKTGENAST